MNIFLNTQQQLRSIWWVAIFFLILAAFTFPLIIIAQQYGLQITITQQAIVVIAVTWICQALRKQTMAELLGKPDYTFIKNISAGIVAGLFLMLIPAILLTLFGYISWQQGSIDVSSILNVTGDSLSVAIAEEFLFRGFIFQRLRKSTGLWTAQLLIAAYFLLTHINNPGMTGITKLLAASNIFLASVMFGFAYIKTNSLIMPIAFHFTANWVQGTLLGFGVSGHEQASLLKPVYVHAPGWLTGGSFGLEASVLGLVSVIIAIIILYRWRPDQIIHTHKNRIE
jgi:uncharacterized protein